MPENRIAEYLEALQKSERVGRHVAYRHTVPAALAKHAEPRRPWPRALQDLLALNGINALYSHQSQAADMIRSGRNIVAATPTASGKSIIYNLPVIEQHLKDPDSKALYLFPLKALAQDQLRALQEFTQAWPAQARPEAAIYDGDTSQWFRKKIRDKPPAILLTNPEMLHLSLLPYHEKWAAFLAGLSYIVVDEAHTYRGVLGSHMAQVFRRLQRVCNRYGARPGYIFSSATVGNPTELAEQLTGKETVAVTESGAPQAARHYVFINPLESPSSTAIALLQSALHRELRTIVYTQSRKMTELISMWAQQRSGAYKERISAYRAGYMPEERREIEAKMANGELLAVISTSALELGIDIGSLDLCILIGFPGSITAALQRGGRVGRAGRESAVILIGGEDALDQYFMNNPQEFFARTPESAVLNPYNPVILSRHLECAAAEMPLQTTEDWLQEPAVARVVASMEEAGTLLRDKNGTRIFAKRKQPHRNVDLRGAGGTYTIETTEGNVVGHADEHRVFKETHPGAVYLHHGQSYVVQDLDLNTRTVVVAPAKVDYYTRTRGSKSTEVLEVLDRKPLWSTGVCMGRLRVTEEITGYEKRRVRGGTILTVVPLDLPPLVFETEGLWLEIPLEAMKAAEKEYLHFMGGIHALEHAMIGVLPLLVMTDRNDLGGISTPMHAQVGLPAVFVYDGAPGGVGLTRQAYDQAEELLQRTYKTIAGCECETGCPSCVHSPKCGSGNRPIDKDAALFLLEQLHDAPSSYSASDRIQIDVQCTNNSEKHPDAHLSASKENLRYGVFDLETQLSAEEVGGWRNAAKMRVSVAVLYDSQADDYLVYQEKDMDALIERMHAMELVVGFNTKRFDYTVLSAYTSADVWALPSLDMLEEVYRRLNYRLSLNHLAKATLNAAKTANGLQALAWWKEGKIDEIATYCKADVAVTRDLYLYGREHGYLLFTNKAKMTVRAPVSW